MEYTVDGGIMDTEDLATEKRLLSLMLRYEPVLKDVKEKLHVQSFHFSLCQQLCQILVDYHDVYNVLPTPEIVDTIIKDKRGENDDEQMSLFTKQLYNDTVTLDEAAFIISRIQNYKVMRELLNSLDRHTSNLTVENIQETATKLENDLMGIREKNSILDKRHFELHEDMTHRVLKYEITEENQVRIPSGYKAIDELTGGFRPSELIIFVAESGGGKSITLMNVAENANKLGFNVAYFSLEMSYEEYLDRWNSLVTEIEQKKIRNRQYSDDEYRKFIGRSIIRTLDPVDHDNFRQYMKQTYPVLQSQHLRELTKYVDANFKKKTNKFHFFDVPQHCNIRTIESELRKITKVAPCHLVIVDYLNIMEPTTNTGLFAFDHGNIARELKALARSMKLTMISAGQMLMTKTKTKELSQLDMKYARAINENADYVFMHHQDSEDKMLNRIRLKLVKHRHTEEKTFSLRTEFEKMQISNFYEITE